MTSKDEDQERQLTGGPAPQTSEVDPTPTEPPQGQPGKDTPGRQRGTDESFTGRAAQLAVMAELLRLPCNVAIPEVDLGTDVFVFKDDKEEVVRLQVKSCTVPYIYADGSGYSAKFALPLNQFHRMADRPPLYYALAVLRDDKWVDFLVVSRARLQSYYNGTSKFGSVDKANGVLIVTVEFRDTVACSGQILTDCRNAWKSLPPLQTMPDPEPMLQAEAAAPGQAAAGSTPPAEPGRA